MLQLRHIRNLAEMSGSKYSEIVPLQFGNDGDFDGNTFVAASAFVPSNSSLVVLRVQCYMVNTDSTANDFQFYRAFPPADADWEINDLSTISGGALWANAFLDTDVFLIFPSGKFANLIFTPQIAPPGAGTYVIRTIVFGYLVPARVTDALAQTQALASGA